MTRYIIWNVDRSECFSIDPFKRPNFSFAGDTKTVAYEAWLVKAVDDFALAAQRMQGDGDFKGMPQLERYLKNVLRAVGTTIDKSTNQHLPLSDVFSLLHSDHPRYKIVLRQVYDKLDPQVRADFDMLEELSTNRQEELTRSTLNRLRSLLSPLISQVFHQTSEQFDFRAAIENHHQVILNVEPTNCFSSEQAIAVVNICINQLRAAIRDLGVSNDRRFYLIIDEVSKFVGKDLASLLKEERKRGLSAILIGQDYGSFEIDKDSNLIRDIHGNTGTFISFQQGDPDDCELMGKYFSFPQLQLEERMQPMVVPEEPKFVQLLDYSYGISCSEGGSDGTVDSDAASEGIVNSESTSLASTSSGSNSWSSSIGSNSFGSECRSVNMTPIYSDGQLISMSAIPSSPAITVGSGLSNNRMEGGSAGYTDTRASSTSKGLSKAIMKARSISPNANWQKGNSKSRTIKTVTIPQHEIVDVPTGQPVLSIELQRTRYAKRLTTFGVGQCFVRTRLDGCETTLPLQVLPVEEPYLARDEYARAIFEMKSFLVKPYNHIPSSMSFADQKSQRSSEESEGLAEPF
ncbi:MAG: type IV secretion system DNA-binding domain-containing protein [Planctomycetota bacterium]